MVDNIEHTSKELGENTNDSDISTGISDLMAPYCKKYGFDADLCEKLKEMPPLHAVITAYGYLSNEGLDARIILEEFLPRVGLK